MFVSRRAEAGGNRRRKGVRKSLVGVLVVVGEGYQNLRDVCYQHWTLTMKKIPVEAMKAWKDV